MSKDNSGQPSSDVRSILKRTGAGLAAFGGGILGAAQGLSGSVGHYLPYVNTVGGSLAVAGLVSTAFGFLWISRRPRWDNFRARPMRSDELLAMQEVLKEFGGTEITSVESKREFQTVNSEIFYVIEDVRKVQKPVPIGYWFVYPLKHSILEKMKSGQMLGWFGPRANVAGITKPRGRPAALYIGFIWGKDRQSKAAVLRLLGDYLTHWCRSKNVYQVLARPMTIDALRLARRHRFKQISDDAVPNLRTICYKVWDVKAE